MCTAVVVSLRINNNNNKTVFGSVDLLTQYGIKPTGVGKIILIFDSYHHNRFHFHYPLFLEFRSISSILYRGRINTNVLSYKRHISSGYLTMSLLKSFFKNKSSSNNAASTNTTSRGTTDIERADDPTKAKDQEGAIITTKLTEITLKRVQRTSTASGKTFSLTPNVSSAHLRVEVKDGNRRRVVTPLPGAGSSVPDDESDDGGEGGEEEGEEEEEEGSKSNNRMILIVGSRGKAYHLGPGTATKATETNVLAREEQH